MQIFSVCAIITSTARASSVSVSSYTNMIFNQSCSTHIFLGLFSKYEIIHIWTAVVDESEECSSLLMCGLIAQLVEHHTSIAEDTGSNPVEALIFFQASFFQLLKFKKNNCNDHSSLYLLPQFKYKLCHIYFMSI